MSLRRISGTAFALFLLLSAYATAQTTPPSGRLSGVIVYQPESVPLIYAHIWIHELSGKSSFLAQPDRNGAYSIQLPEGYFFVLIGAPGFAPVTKSIWIREGKPIVFSPRMSPDEENQQDGL